MAGRLRDLVADAGCDREQVAQPSRPVSVIPGGHRGDFPHDLKHQGHRVRGGA
jgi:hypothetical protein